jgi:murein DD-endopeptidase MepM/ murein hydrolase activator NlpD
MSAKLDININTKTANLALPSRWRVVRAAGAVVFAALIIHARSAVAQVHQKLDAISECSADMTLSPPTELGSRQRDAWGAGSYGASRDGGKRKHTGLDILSSSGFPVGAPVSGVISRLGQVYEGDTALKLVEIKVSDGCVVSVFYVDPSVKEGDQIERGQEIGQAQSLDKRYPGISNHVHLAVKSGAEFVDPTRFVANSR